MMRLSDTPGLVRRASVMRSVGLVDVVSRWLAVVSLAMCSGGCSDPARPNDPPPTAAPSGAPNVDGVLPLGTVEGLVRLADGASLPMFAENPMIARGPAASLPPECTPPSEDDRRPVRVGASGGLTNLVIVATGDASRWPDSAGPRTHQARIENCRLAPQVLVAERGDTIHFENPTTFPFFPDLGTGFSRALLPSDPLDLLLDRGGVRVIQCALSTPCGRMDVVTLYHPVHAVSDAEGRFRLPNVPAGQDVRITAWHPLFQEASVETRVEAGGVVRVELTIQPAPPAAVEPAAPEVPRDPLAGDIPE
ncbi:MAG: hypothetical protein OHK0013_11690 [Sandaracinaceae bacterium]